MYVAEILWRNSPEYAKAYKEGYDQARLEMMEMLKKMTALYETSTVSLGDGGKEG